MSTKTSAVFGVLTVIAASEAEYKTLQKSFAQKGLLYTSSVGQDDTDKSPEEVRLEAEFCQLTGQKRFRMSKAQKAEVDGGDKTRIDFLKAEVAQLKRAKTLASKKAVKKSAKTETPATEEVAAAV